MKTDFPYVSRLIKKTKISEMMASITEIACELSGCSRSCLILKEEKSFTIRAGFEESRHGIGQEVSEDGKKLLQQILDEKKIMIIGRPGSDPKTRYIYSLIKANKISAIMFIPLFHNNTDIGILTIDAIEKERTSLFLTIKEIKEFAELCSILLWKEMETKKINEKILVKANLSVLGEHAARISHTLKNALLVLTGFTEHSIIEMEKDDGKIDADKKEKLLKGQNRILDKSLKMENFVNKILKFSKSNGICLEKSNINEFLQSMVIGINIKKQNIETSYDLEKHLDETLVLFDQILLGDSIYDILINGIEAGATKFSIKTVVHPDKNIFRIIIGNNGKIISTDDLPHIFSPFFTTKEEGTGIGLANVWKIVIAHGGSITAKSGNGKTCNDKHGICTWFNISLPLKR